MTYKLGKRPAKRDPRTYRLTPALTAHWPSVPEAQDWSDKVDYQMWGNDTCGCCGLASQAGFIATWTKNAQSQVLLSTDQVIANYADVSGYDPRTGINDDGVILLDVLKIWRKNGFRRPGPDKDILTAFGYVERKDVMSVKRCIAFLGGIIGGVQMVQGFMELEPGDTWDLDKVSNHMPVGGHAIAVTGYNKDGLFFASWGARSFMPWATWQHISDESYGLLSRQNWLGDDGKSPKDQTFDALLSEIRSL
ncbi:Peptidase-C39-2 domain-containing protein [Acetobacteraceae bacterium EV16G]|uniref:Peptidase-C39-2 domain-containing protein n=1 Tax=Sorlinia euscelidii TaxID=3081148 RepID=A0ABU7U6Y6_9PROT